ncbi:MAG: toll/interleukin-1 receptor domain-containing protein [Bryobacteraceae bacterium]
MQPSTKVFLSYAHADSKPARELAEYLQREGFRVWDPDFELLPGSEWTSTLRSALDSADALVVLLSPAAMESRSVVHEIEYALGAKHLRGRLIPVLLRPTRQVPWILNELQMIHHQSTATTGKEIADSLTRPPYVPKIKVRTG